MTVVINVIPVPNGWSVPEAWNASCEANDEEHPFLMDDYEGEPSWASVETVGPRLINIHCLYTPMANSHPGPLPADTRRYKTNATLAEVISMGR